MFGVAEALAVAGLDEEIEEEPAEEDELAEDVLSIEDEDVELPELPEELPEGEPEENFEDEAP